MKHGYKFINFVKNEISSTVFVNNHKSQPKDFTRTRTLSFQVLFIQLLRKTVKSLQVSLNELYMSEHISTPVSASAYSQARKKFKHTAFVELDAGIIQKYYAEESSLKNGIIIDV